MRGTRCYVCETDSFGAQKASGSSKPQTMCLIPRRPGFNWLFQPPQNGRAVFGGTPGGHLIMK